MGVATCTECGGTFTFDVIPRRGKICFKCHVGSVNLGFSQGKEYFHGPTEGERRAEIERDAAAQGRQIERLPSKAWV